MPENPEQQTDERVVEVSGGWPMLAVLFALVAVTIFSFASHSVPIAVILSLVTVVCFLGFFSLQPNEARVLVLFGTYKGTVRSSGFHWSNPFYSRARGVKVASSASEKNTPVQVSGYKISLRARTLDIPTLKVNDKNGNPIEIAAVVVWRVANSAQALFDVDNYESYVQTQSETALRHLASHYAYDHGESEEPTLRSNVEEVSLALCDELRDRLRRAGVAVDEARLTHLAYAPEIAQAMLRRQQAEAIIAAREKIVHGAVSMVEMALRELADKDVSAMSNDQKAELVTNLMVVLCSESEVHPMLHAGARHGPEQR